MEYNKELNERSLYRAFVRVWKAQHRDVKLPTVKCVHTEGGYVDFLLAGASSNGTFPGWGYRASMDQMRPLALAAACRQRRGVDKHRFSRKIGEALTGFSRGRTLSHEKIERELRTADGMVGSVQLSALVLRGKTLERVRAYGLEYPIRGLLRYDTFCGVCCDFGGKVPFELVGGQGGRCPPRPPRGSLRRVAPKHVATVVPEITPKAELLPSSEPSTTECELGQADGTPRSSVWASLFGE